MKNTYADRAFLHKSKLEEFKLWLIQNGWQIKDHSRNEYAVLRAENKEKSPHPLIIYERANSTEHYTVQGRHRGIVSAFIHRRDREKGNLRGLDVIAPSETPTTHSYGRLLTFFCARCGQQVAALYETDPERGGGISPDMHYCFKCGNALHFGKYYKADAPQGAGEEIKFEEDEQLNNEVGK